MNRFRRKPAQAIHRTLVFEVFAMLELRPNCECCGGELVARPVRQTDKLAQYPASTIRKHRPEKCGAAA